jgi:glycine oxidase
MSGPSLGIVGAGVTGRMLSLLALKRGMKVSLFEKKSKMPHSKDQRPCSLVAAGMLSPYCELEKSDVLISELGVDSLNLWEEIVPSMGGDIFFQRKGGIVLSHPEDQNEMLKLEKILGKNQLQHTYKHLNGKELLALESDLSPHFSKALFFENEGQIDPWSFYRSFNESILPQCEESFFETDVLEINPHGIKTSQKNYTFDWVIDCRGLEAKKDERRLRGVRGEIIKIRAPGINLLRPLRLMHPRYCLYIVPREDNQYLIGATNLESEDYSPISVRSALELLSACYSVNSSFSEARIVEMDVHCRPAFPDNNPKIILKKAEGLVMANGLYRHGYLISPKIADLVLNKLDGQKKIEEKYEPLIEEWP